MELMRGSFFADYFFACRLAAADIGGGGGAPRGFMPENCFGASGKRGFCGSQSQAGLAIQPLVGLGFGWRRLGAGRDCIARFKYIAAILSALSRHIDSLCGRAMAVPAAQGVVNVMDTPTLNPSPKMREGLQWRKPPLPSLVAGDGGMSSIFIIPFASMFLPLAENLLYYGRKFIGAQREQL